MEYGNSCRSIMPDDNEKSDPNQEQLDLNPTMSGDQIGSIPAIVPPQTAVPFHFQQVNIQQIPPESLG